MPRGSTLKGRAVFVGWSSRLPKEDPPAVCLPVDDLARTSLAGCRVVVLGEDAIAGLDPGDCALLFSPVRGRVVVCVDAGDAAVLWRWAVLGFPHLSLRDLPAFLVQSAQRPPRPSIPPDRWLPHPLVRGTAASRAAAAVPTLNTLRVKAWAVRLGWSRDHLLRVCERELGMSAKRALQCYLLATFDELARDEITWADRADLLGYCDAVSLRRALRSARSEAPLQIDPSTTA